LRGIETRKVAWNFFMYPHTDIHNAPILPAIVAAGKIFLSMKIIRN
jgi:hypothetical protein